MSYYSVTIMWGDKMQISRLFEIVYILLDKKTVTASELAKHFEVSTRTIYRDVEIISTAGIPIFMSKGKGGGISLLDNFVLNKSVLSEQEQQEILSALQGLGATNYPDTDKVLSKLSLIFNKNSQDWIEVDFSDWSDNKDKWDIIKTSILSKNIIAFDYYSSYGEKTTRKVMPVKLWFKQKTWYLKAFCIDKQSMRTFKLTRIKNLQMTNEVFDNIINESDIIPCNTIPNNLVTVILKIDASQAYRVYDEFEENQVEKNEDNSFIVTFAFPEDEWVYGFILSFGCFAQVLEPPHIREIIKAKLQKSLDMYL